MHAVRVDFGGTIDCNIKSDVFAAVHTEMPSFAYHCVLHGVDERPAAAITTMLKQYHSSIPLYARVQTRRSSSENCVELVDTRNGREIRLADLLLAATTAEIPPPADVTAPSVEFVYVPTITADGEFFGQLAKYDSDVFQQFRSRMNNFYQQNRVPTVASPRPGDFCCCQFDFDKLYYRSRILRQFSADKYVVSSG